uniref:Uncharacterized protein n=1 Tax=Meloidogyne enterolobii TaxID=390850 RepID=A0A6V7XAR8_MELEN|nr:unnamed protein product [Meloidogyne enterolobii]
MSRQFIEVSGSNCTFTVGLTSAGTLQLEVLQGLFSADACGLKYLNENASLNNDEPSTIFVFFDEFSQCFIEPLGGWANKKFEVVYRSDGLDKNKQLRVLPTSDKITKYLFHIPMTKSCVLAVTPNYLTTFSHGRHNTFKIGEQLLVYNDNYKYETTIEFISKKYDFVLLKSENKCIEEGPPIDYVHSTGSEICLIGFQSDFEHLSTKKGKIFLTKWKLLKVEQFKIYYKIIVLIQNLVGSDDVGPFLIGTISPSSCDDGAGVWSADGLVGLNLGAVTCHGDAGNSTMNMMGLWRMFCSRSKNWRQNPN